MIDVVVNKVQLNRLIQAKCFSGFLFLLLFSPLSSAVPTVKVAASEFPPYYIFNQTDNNLTVSGFEVDLDKEISQKLGVQFQYVPCPWIRCLKLLKEGKADMVGAIIDLPKRRSFLEFVNPGYSLINGERKVFFYQRKSDRRLISNLTDLKRGTMLIGVVRGERYFQEFDQSDMISKFAVSSSSEALDLLIKGKIDVVAMLETQTEWLGDKYQGRVYPADFIHSNYEIAHKALSKKGQALALKNAMGEIIAELQDNGFINQLYEKYRYPDQ